MPGRAGHDACCINHVLMDAVFGDGFDGKVRGEVEFFLNMFWRCRKFSYLCVR